MPTNSPHQNEESTARPAGDVFDAAAYMSTYYPRKGRAARYWPQTKDFVTELVVRLSPPDAKRTAYVAWVLAGISAYAVSTGVPLDAEHVLHPSFVERYIAVGWDGKPGNGSPRTVRDQLRKIGPQLTSKAPWQPRERAIGRSHLPSPYTDHDYGLLWTAAATQPLGDDRYRLEFLLAAGRGWGLDGRWATRIEPGSTWIDDHGIHTRVPNPNRVVTCLFSQQARLRTAIERVQLIEKGSPFKTSKALNSFTGRMNGRLGRERVDLGRLRSTWLLDHLRRSTPLPALLQGAGLKTAGGLTELIALVEQPEPDALARLLRAE